MRFWRIVPNGATRLGVQTSPDGANWVEQLDVVRAPMAAYRVQLMAGTPDGAEPAPGSAVFESISVCPP